MVQFGDNQEAMALVCVCLFLCVLVMVHYGDNIEATVLVCVLVCVFVMVQSGDNLCDGSI